MSSPPKQAWHFDQRLRKLLMEHCFAKHLTEKHSVSEPNSRLVPHFCTVSVIRSAGSNRSGFTLVELLVVIAITGIFAGLLLPAIQQVRESARRASCTSNLAQVGMALNGYQLAFRHLPSGSVNDTGPITNTPIGFHHGWIIAVLPFMDEHLTYKNVDLSSSIYAASNVKIRARSIGILRCPSDPYRGPFSNYAGIHHGSETPIDKDNSGILFLNSRIRRDDIEDGSSYTTAVGEKKVEVSDLGWSSGTRASLRNMGPTSKALSKNSKTFGFRGFPPGVAPDGSFAPGGTQVKLDSRPPETWIDLNEIPLIDGAPSPNLAVGQLSSHHNFGINVLLADGAVEFMSNNIDKTIRSHLGSRNDGNLIPPFSDL